jgi:hypothetical protein
VVVRSEHRHITVSDDDVTVSTDDVTRLTPL